ncbi:MAG: hypothetical protein OEW08_14990, partial [Gammaproteobacteria bacterium]|nr:hypothetical protein [Gammaproteobacteria bacterium]
MRVVSANTEFAPAALHIIAKLTDRRAAELLYQQTLVADRFDQVQLVQGPIAVRTLSLGFYPDERAATQVIAQLQAADITTQLQATATPLGYRVDVVSAYDDRTFDDMFQKMHRLGYRKDILITTAALDDDAYFVVGATRTPRPATPIAAPADNVTATPAPTMPINALPPPQKADVAPWQWLRLLNPLALHSLAAKGEFDHWKQGDVAASGSYFSTYLSFRWRWTESTAVYFGGRADMYEQSSTRTFQQLTTDYESSYWQWQNAGTRITLGQQRLIFGPDARDSLSNRLLVPDLSRTLLESDIQRKTWPTLSARLEYAQEGLHVDMAATPFFEAAKLPHYDSVWSPIDTIKGRLLNRRTPGELGDVIKGSTLRTQKPYYGGAGAQISYSESEIRHALALQYVADATPYFQLSETAGAILRAG